MRRDEAITSKLIRKKERKKDEAAVYYLVTVVSQGFHLLKTMLATRLPVCARGNF